MVLKNLLFVTITFEQNKLEKIFYNKNCSSRLAHEWY